MNSRGFVINPAASEATPAGSNSNRLPPVRTTKRGVFGRPSFVMDPPTGGSNDLLRHIRRARSRSPAAPPPAGILGNPAVMNNHGSPTKTSSSYHLGCSIVSSRIPIYQFATPLARYLAQPSNVVNIEPTCLMPDRRPSTNSTAASLVVDHHPPEAPLSEERVTEFLMDNRNFLEDHVMKHIDPETLERWLIRRTQREAKQHNKTSGRLEATGRKISLSRWKFCVHADKRKMLEVLMSSLASQPEQPSRRILWELACCIASAVGADGFLLHLVHPRTGRLRIFRSDDGEMDVESLSDDDEEGPAPPSANEDQRSVASYISEHRQTILLPDARLSNPKFPAGSRCVQEGGIHVLGAPIVQNDGALAGVLELYRRGDDDGGPFHEEDEEIASSYLVWGGIAVHYADMYHVLAKQRNLQQFLLAVVKSIFQDMISMDSLIAKIMTFARKLVDADRASLFLVDQKAGQLYPRIFDMGTEPDVSANPHQHEIRFSVGTGIAGQVAVTGQGLNIADAYADPRFNRAVDQQTGYRTRSILCMPIFNENQVIGVVQMVNKRHGAAFTAEDEGSFEHFAVYCGLALHHARLYDRVQVSEQKYRVALDVLSYHNCCTDEEFAMMKREDSSSARLPPAGLDQFWFSAFSIGDLEKVSTAVHMFEDLFGLDRFDRDSLLRFTLTVRKNYRRVPYHNWTHGFAVANSTYVLLKRAPKAFQALEAVALFVGSLCHDLDHRGKNNKFMLETASPLAAVYSTSTMEHHHYHQTVTILQQEGHNILSKLDGEEYKEVLENIKHCILATDLASFDGNQKRLTRVVDTGEFRWEEKEHRRLLQAIAMTGSDLCASSKPWEVQAETVRVIFEEFYDQGDAERAAGRTPIPMMDRRKPEEQPASQVGFISFICIPCYGLLYRLIPETKPLLDGCLENLQRWKDLSKERQIESSPAQPHSQVKSAALSSSSGAFHQHQSSSTLTRAVSLPICIDVDPTD